MAFLREEKGPLRRFLDDGPLRRIARGEPPLQGDSFEYQMVPIPPGVDAADWVVQVANGDWARGAAEGWVRRLGLTGTPEGENVKRRMQIAYAAGATKATPEVTAEAQRRLGLVPAPLPTPPPPPPRRAVRRRAAPATPPAAVTVSQRDQQAILSVFDEAVAGGMSPNIPRSSLATEARNKGVREPERAIQEMIDAGLLETSGRFVRKPRPSR